MEAETCRRADRTGCPGPHEGSSGPMEAETIRTMSPSNPVMQSSHEGSSGPMEAETRVALLRYVGRARHEGSSGPMEAETARRRRMGSAPWRSTKGARALWKPRREGAEASGDNVCAHEGSSGPMEAGTTLSRERLGHGVDPTKEARALWKPRRATRQRFDLVVAPHEGSSGPMEAETLSCSCARAAWE